MTKKLKPPPNSIFNLAGREVWAISLGLCPKKARKRAVKKESEDLKKFTSELEDFLLFSLDNQ